MLKSSLRPHLLAASLGLAALFATQAWAQNRGHESPTTTFGSYGKVATHDQGELVRNAGKQTQDTPDGKLDEIKPMIAQLQPRRASTGS